VAEGGDGAAIEASEWENREREEQLALLREEEERLGRRTRRITVRFYFVTLYLPMVFHLSFFCHTTSGSQRAEAST